MRKSSMKTFGTHRLEEANTNKLKPTKIVAPKLDENIFEDDDRTN